MTIKQHIRELHAELRNFQTINERHQIEAQLEPALDELTEKQLPDRDLAYFAAMPMTRRRQHQ